MADGFLMGASSMSAAAARLRTGNTFDLCNSGLAEIDKQMERAGQEEQQGGEGGEEKAGWLAAGWLAQKEKEEEEEDAMSTRGPPWMNGVYLNEP